MLTPILPMILLVGPAVPACALCDAIRFLTKFISTFTGLKSSSISSISSSSSNDAWGGGGFLGAVLGRGGRGGTTFETGWEFRVVLSLPGMLVETGLGAVPCLCFLLGGTGGLFCKKIICDRTILTCQTSPSPQLW